MAQQQTRTQASEGQSIELVTRTGIRLSVRQASPADERKILEFLNAVSAEDLRFRFLNAVKPTTGLAHLLTQTNRDDVENLLAFNAPDGRLAATATIAAEPEAANAEVALVVRSDLKGHGIGWTLLGHVSDLARIRGFRRIECIESSDNQTAIRLEEEFGFRRRPHPGDTTVTMLSKDL